MDETKWRVGWALILVGAVLYPLFYHYTPGRCLWAVVVDNCTCGASCPYVVCQLNIKDVLWTPFLIMIGTGLWFTTFSQETRKR